MQILIKPITYIKLGLAGLNLLSTLIGKRDVPTTFRLDVLDSGTSSSPIRAEFVAFYGVTRVEINFVSVRQKAQSSLLTQTSEKTPLICNK